MFAIDFDNASVASATNNTAEYGYHHGLSMSLPYAPHMLNTLGPIPNANSGWRPAGVGNRCKFTLYPTYTELSTLQY
jgi:hypothetical protein